MLSASLQSGASSIWAVAQNVTSAIIVRGWEAYQGALKHLVVIRSVYVNDTPGTDKPERSCVRKAVVSQVSMYSYSQPGLGRGSRFHVACR